MALLQGSVVRRIPMHLMQKSAVFGLFLIVPAFIIVGLANSVKFLYLGMIFFAICECCHFVIYLLTNFLKIF